MVMGGEKLRNDKGEWLKVFGTWQLRNKKRILLKGTFFNEII